jgi:hypothetical protein
MALFIAGTSSPSRSDEDVDMDSTRSTRRWTGTAWALSTEWFRFG